MARAQGFTSLLTGGYPPQFYISPSTWSLLASLDNYSASPITLPQNPAMRLAFEASHNFYLYLPKELTSNYRTHHELSNPGEQI